MIPIDLLVREVSADDIFEKSLDVLERVKIPARSWREGGVARSLLGVFCEVGAMGAAIVRSTVAGFFLLFARGVPLTAHAKDVYNVDRIAATFASGKVTLTNAGGGVYPVAANTMIVRSSNTGARYRVTQAFTLGANTSLDVDVQAVTAGAASSVAPAELDELETPLARVTVHNAASIVGRDEESDDELVARCLARKGTWSPFGPRDAYEFEALSAKLPDGTPTSITRVSVSRYSSTGQVTIVCATPNGTPTGDELDAVREAIELRARADTATATTSGAVPKATAHTIIIWARGGTEAVLRANAQKALATFYARYPIGGLAKTEGGQGYLYADAIAAAVIASSVEAFDVDFVGGAVDTPLAWNEVATNTTTFEVRIR